MNLKKHTLTIVIVFLCFVIYAQDVQKPKTSLESILNKFKLSSDFRYRIEEDWNSRNNNGTFRPDRFRMRLRFRVQTIFKLDENISFGARLRTGNPRSQQSPHITIGGQSNDDADGTNATQRVAGEFEPYSFLFDKVYVKFNKNYGDINLWSWLGKNTNPFWHQNELFWDDDVSPEGVTIGQKFNTSKNLKINFTEGYYVLYGTGNTYAQNDPSMLGFQTHLNYSNKKIDFNFASAYFMMSQIPLTGDADIANLTTTDKINYNFLNTSFNFTFKSSFPIKIGVDYIINLENYNSNKYTTISKSNAEFRYLKDKKNGYVLTLTLGQLKEKHDLRLKYTYSYINRFSVIDYLAQDDWVRWGNVNRNRCTNFKGHEINIAYAISKRFNIVSRLYLVDAIEKRKESNTSLESGNRYRLDLNFKF